MTQETKTAEATPEVAQAKPEPTIEELRASLAQVQQELTKKEQDLKSARDEAKAHQKFGQEKQAELKNQSDLREEFRGLREDYEILAVALASKDEVEPTDGTSRQNVLTELQKRRVAADTKRQQESDARARQEYNLRADTLYAQAKTLYGEGEEEKLEDIEDLLKSGNISRAQQRIDRVTKSKTSVTKDKPPEESEGEIRERIFREEMEKRYPDIYRSDIGTPSGSLVSTADAQAAYSRGEITAEEAKKKGVIFS